MTELRSKLHLIHLSQDLVEFACTLVDMTEFEDRLDVPSVYVYYTGIEMVWRCGPNTLRIRITTAGNYTFVMEIAGQGEVLRGETRNSKQLVQQLRNMFFWLWDDPW